ncbi:Protein-associating with the carboxyl-terminal domain of ezrin, partial [Nowakowskiella sp. JEL0407]
NKWVLGGLELSTHFKQVNAALLPKIHARIPDETIPPEDLEESPNFSLVSARDLFAIGHLIINIIDTCIQPINQDRFSLSWHELRDLALQMTRPDPTLRPPSHSLSTHPFFSKNKVIKVINNFLGELRTLSPTRKVQYFSELYADLKDISTQTIVKYVLPVLLVPDMFAEPGADRFFAQLLGKSSNLDEVLLPREIYMQFVTPFVIESLKLRQYHVRIVLLKLLDGFISSLLEFDKQVFEKVIFPEIMIGLEDQSNEIYCNSLIALFNLTPKYISHILSEKSNSASNIELPDHLNQRSSSETARNSFSNRRRNSNAPTPTASKKTDPKLSENSNNRSRYNPTMIVDTIIVPHSLNVCLSLDITPELQDAIFQRLITMWKKLVVMESSSRTSDATQIKTFNRSLMKNFHLILRVLPPDQKSVFLVEKLVGPISELDATSSHWIPRILELGIPFLRDENRQVRRAVGELLNSLITFLSNISDRTPTVSRKRDGDANLILQLRKLYHEKLPRDKRLVVKTGPDFSHLGVGVQENVSVGLVDIPPKDVAPRKYSAASPTNGEVQLVAPEVEQTPEVSNVSKEANEGWEEKWDDDGFDPEQPQQQELDSTTSSHKVAADFETTLALPTPSLSDITIDSTITTTSPIVSPISPTAESDEMKAKKQEMLKQKREMRLAEVQKRKSLKFKASKSDINLLEAAASSENGTNLEELWEVKVKPLVLRKVQHASSSTERKKEGEEGDKETNGASQVDFFKDMDPLNTQLSRNVSGTSLGGLSETGSILKMLQVQNAEDDNTTNSFWGDEELNL